MVMSNRQRNAMY